ncbi:hypothetical protein ACFWOB_13630 [Streptomyces sp. NPDC058420]
MEHLERHAPTLGVTRIALETGRRNTVALAFTIALATCPARPTFPDVITR